MKEIKNMTESEIDGTLKNMVNSWDDRKVRKILLENFLEEELKEKKEIVWFYRERS